MVVTEWQVDLDTALEIAADESRRTSERLNARPQDERAIGRPGALAELSVIAARSWADLSDCDPADEGPIEP